MIRLMKEYIKELFFKKYNPQNKLQKVHKIVTFYD